MAFSLVSADLVTDQQLVHQRQEAPASCTATCEGQASSKRGHRIRPRTLTAVNIRGWLRYGMRSTSYHGIGWVGLVAWARARRRIVLIPFSSLVTATRHPFRRHVIRASSGTGEVGIMSALIRSFLNERSKYSERAFERKELRNQNCKFMCFWGQIPGAAHSVAACGSKKCWHSIVLVVDQHPNKHIEASCLHRAGRWHICAWNQFSWPKDTVSTMADIVMNCDEAVTSLW